MLKRNTILILGILLIITFVLYNFVFQKINENFNEDNVTVVSGYWQVGNKYGDNKYDAWFKNTLRINQRYVFFCDKSMNSYISQFRGDYETKYVDYSMDSFYSKNYALDDWIDTTHVPSKELGMIWNEKIHMLKLAKDMDPNPTKYYIWIDAAVAPYRNTIPQQSRLNIDLSMLPPNKLYYSYVKDDYHNFAATVLIIDSNIIDVFHDKYYDILQNCNDKWKCGSDQYIFTKMMELYPEYFYKISEGYGENLVTLYEKYLQE